MEKKFIIPASTMFLGIIAWVILLLVINKGDSVLWHELLSGILVGGLISVSAFTCRRADGPRAGNIFRTVLLLVMAIVTYLLIGAIFGSLLLVSAIITGTIAYNTKPTVAAKT